MPINHFSTSVPVFCDSCDKKMGEIDVPLHGGVLHSTYIMIAKYILWKRGIKIKNPDAFATMYHCPGVPDIYVEYSYKGKDDYGRTKTITKCACVEIETHPTKGGNEDKYNQFCRPGIREPIILSMGKDFEKWKEEERKKGSTEDDIMLAYRYIDYFMVF